MAEMADLTSTFNKNTRPVLDAMDKLRDLNVMNEGIPLPTIVVVGDQSSGKSSVLESLANISLPRGDGIATRVPLVLRLESCGSEEETSIDISYSGYSKNIEADEIEAAVDEATNVLAGTEKGVFDSPISLHIRKPGAPDITMIDLPGITRVAVNGQPEDIYEQISEIIGHYLSPKETVILNVLSATVDKEGERTLAVVTKVDRDPEGVLEKVTKNDVNIGLGYICVRNRTDDESSHEIAREKEKDLFENHPSLSKLDKDHVGISSLAERLTQIQADIIRRSLPEIEEKIEKSLTERRKELDALTQGSAGEDPTDLFLRIVDNNKSLLQDIMLYGRYNMFHDQNDMHYPPRLEEMFSKFNENLYSVLQSILPDTKTKEILAHGRAERINITQFLSPTLMSSLVEEEVDKVGEFCTSLVPETHSYAKRFIFCIIQESSKLYPNLEATYKEEVENALSVSHASCMGFVKRVLEKERATVFTMNDLYMANVKKLQDHVSNIVTSDEYAGSMALEGFQEAIDMWELFNTKANDYQCAFTMKVSLAAYWKVVHKRIVDQIALEIKYSLEEALLKKLRNAVLKAKMGQDLSKLMEVNASTLQKKLTLHKRVEILEECKGVLQALF